MAHPQKDQEAFLLHHVAQWGVVVVVEGEVELPGAAVDLQDDTEQTQQDCLQWTEATGTILVSYCLCFKCHHLQNCGIHTEKTYHRLISVDLIVFYGEVYGLKME